MVWGKQDPLSLDHSFCPAASDSRDPGGKLLNFFETKPFFFFFFPTAVSLRCCLF